MDERPVPQEPLQKTAATQPYPRGDAFVPQCAEPVEGFPFTGCIFTPYREVPIVIQPRSSGGSEWSPAAFSPQTGYLYVSGVVQNGMYTRHPGEDETAARHGDAAELGEQRLAFTQAHQRGVHRAGDVADA